MPKADCRPPTLLPAARAGVGCVLAARLNEEINGIVDRFADQSDAESQRDPMNGAETQRDRGDADQRAAGHRQQAQRRAPATIGRRRATASPPGCCWQSTSRTAACSILARAATANTPGPLSCNCTPCRRACDGSSRNAAANAARIASIARALRIGVGSAGGGLRHHQARACRPRRPKLRRWTFGEGDARQLVDDVQQSRRSDRAATVT